MTINNFSALIQLAATLSIAFVAVEYVKSYTSVLCEKFFKFHEFIKDSFEQCRAILTDIDTLSHIQPIDIGGGKTTNSEIEAAKRNNEALTKEIDTEEQKKKEEMNCVCQAKSMSSMCFFIFLYNTLLLFVGGVEESHPYFVHSFSFSYGLLGVLYIVFGWWLGEKEEPARFCDFASLRHSIFGFLIIFLLSLISAIIVHLFFFDWFLYMLAPYWWYLFIITLLFTYANFVIFVFKIRIKAKSFKNTVLESKSKLEEKCKKAEESVSDLMGTTRLISKLQAD